MSTETQTFESIRKLRDALPSLPDDAVILDRDGDKVRRSDVRIVFGNYAPYTVRYESTTPAPLDPSKVRAGDTVTLLVDPPDTHPAFTVAGETHSLGGPTVYLGGWRVDDLPDYVTLTEHQPAPEPEPEWKPGTIGTAGTVRGLGYTGPVVRTDEHLLPWWTPSRVDGAHYHGEETVTDFVPDEPKVPNGVVIDPAAVDWRGLQSQMSVLVVGAEPFKRAGEILDVVRRELGIEATS